jgi:outer membrane receptor protein involved in Fe transport
VRNAVTKEWLFEGEMEIPGVEFEISAQVIDPITIWGVFGYNWAEWEKPEDVDGDGVVGVDPWNLSVGIDWKSLFGLEGRIEYITNGKQWMTTSYDRKEDDYYNILNMYATYHMFEALDVFLKLNNILDERYCMWPAYDYYRPEPGFNFSAGFKVFF